MTQLNQIPADLDITISVDDGFSYLFDSDINLTGYTFVAKVQASGGTETTITVTNTDLTNGQITLSLTTAQITAIGEGAHNWYLTWTVGGLPRRAVAGDFIIKRFPQ